MWAYNWHNWQQGKLLVVLCSVSSRLLVPGLSCVRISSGLLVLWWSLVPSTGLSLVLSSRWRCHLFPRRFRLVSPGCQSCYSFSMKFPLYVSATVHARQLVPFETKTFRGVGCLLFYSFNYLLETLFIAYSLIISARRRNGELSPMKRVSIFLSRCFPSILFTLSC